jgi:hypothetical protein
MANGLKKAYVREKVYRFGKTVANTKVTGKTTEQMVMGD